MPAASWRTMPARSMSRCDTISAYFGVSRRIGRKKRDRRIGDRPTIREASGGARETNRIGGENTRADNAFEEALGVITLSQARVTVGSMTPVRRRHGSSGRVNESPCRVLLDLEMPGR